MNMTSSCLRCCVALLALPLLATASFAADNFWSIEYFNSRKSEWEQLIGPTIRLEGRITLHGKGQLRLAKCDLVFHVPDNQLRPLAGKKSVELSGRLKKDDGKLSFEVTQIQTAPTDVEQFESRTAKLRNPKPSEWYELGDWASSRARFYDDAELNRKAAIAYANGVKVEWRSLPAEDGEARVQLAAKARQLNLPEDQRAELLHEGYWQLWHAAANSKQPDSKTLAKLAERMAEDLPGSTVSRDQAAPELKQSYEREPLIIYRESNEATRQVLHRFLYAATVLKPILLEAASDGHNGNEIADRIEKAIPEEKALAEKYRDGKLAWRLARAATATRQEIEQLASDYRARQQPVPARLALQTWLQSREGRMREDGADGLMQLADDYLVLLKDESKAASFLKEAYTLDPKFEDVHRRLTALGYRLDRDNWTKEAPKTNPADNMNSPATQPGNIVVGMTASALRTMMGRPNSIARAVTGDDLVEVWCFGNPGTSRVIVHLSRKGQKGEAKVIEFGNEK